MPSIHRLDDRLVSQIAAGEVVERPASVVKELVENALDAGARELAIQLEEGGRTRILVVDDGCGMARADAELAVERHATSKIASFDDLTRVATLGFRGEALAAISAVARFDLLTAAAPGDGWRVRVDGARLLASEPATRAVGTTIEVADLFFNVPARREFLKTPAAELRRAVEVVQGYALARCDVRFRLDHGERSILDTEPAPGDPRQRIADLFGGSLADQLVEIPDLGERGEVIAGFIGRPRSAGGRRAFVFVNGRLLRDRTIVGLFYRLVRDEWHSDRFPPLFLFLDVPAEHIDVNVHPQKAEVRFRDRSAMDHVRRALRSALLAAREGGASAPLGRLGEGLPPRLAWEGLGGVGEIREPAGFAAPSPSLAGGDGSAAPTERVATGRDATAIGTLPRLAEPRLARRPVPLSGQVASDRGLVFLGQYKASLLVLESPTGLVLIDQHAAHERIRYERLRIALEREQTPSQRLLSPVLLELGPAERLALGALAEPLAEHGFELVPLSGRELALAAIPAALDQAEAEALLLELAAGGGVGDLRERMLVAVAAEQACRGAVRIHRRLADEQAEALVGELFQCADPWSCPHGRPTVLELADADLERRFGRR